MITKVGSRKASPRSLLFRVIMLLIVVDACLGISVAFYELGLKTDVTFVKSLADIEVGPINPAAWPDLLGTDGQLDEMQVAETLSLTLGTPPNVREYEREAVRIEWLGEEKLSTHKRVKLTYGVRDGEPVPAYLLVPNSGGTRPGPAVLALHQTTDAGKDEVVGIRGNPDFAYGKELVERGYVVLAPDAITAGERISSAGPFNTDSFYTVYPDWSALGKMLQDHQRGIDVLETLATVDPQRIGVIGHSLGGQNALFLAAFDQRVKVVVVNCAYERIETDEGRERWSRTFNFIYTPHLREYVRPGAERRVPWDFQHLLALIEPRPLFQSFGLYDCTWSHPRTPAQIHAALHELYGGVGKGELLHTEFFSGGHGFPVEVRARAYEFLDRFLMTPAVEVEQ